MLKKKWLLKEFDKARVLEISKKFGISPLTSIILSTVASKAMRKYKDFYQTTLI